MNTGTPGPQQVHRRRLEHIVRDAAALAAAARKIAEAAAETIAGGGQLQVQPQINALTGAHARLLKDWGVIEHLQLIGTRQREGR